MSPEAAFELVRSEYAQNMEDPTHKHYLSGGSYPNYGKQGRESANAVLARRAKIFSDLNNHPGGITGALKDPKVEILTNAEYSKVGTDYGHAADFRWPPIIQTLAHTTKRSPLSVYNEIRVAKGDAPIAYPTPRFPANEVRNTNLISRYVTKNRAVRSVAPASTLSNPATMRQTFANQNIVITNPYDDTPRSTGSDYSIGDGTRGVPYTIPLKGTVLKVVKNNEEIDATQPGYKPSYGNYVEVRVTLPSGRQTDLLFSHFDQHGEYKVGDVLQPGTFLGTQGRTGSTTGPHISMDAFMVGSSTPDPKARDEFLRVYLGKQ